MMKQAACSPSFREGTVPVAHAILGAQLHGPGELVHASSPGGRWSPRAPSRSASPAPKAMGSSPGGLVETTVDHVLGREAELIGGLTSEQQLQLTELLRLLLQD